MTCAGWDFEAELAERHRADVRRFLREIFPREDERRVAVAWAASLLRGVRTSKKILVLTDQSGGNNGKSTLARALAAVLGAFAAKRNDLPYQSDVQGMNAHSGGLAGLAGKRLVYAEELSKTRRMNTSLLKDLVGGRSQQQGRLFGSAEHFGFRFDAGILLLANQGCLPQMDTADVAFLWRLVFAPMRAKFALPSAPAATVADMVCDEDIAHGAAALTDVEEEMTDASSVVVDQRMDIGELLEGPWRSALLLELLDHYLPEAELETLLESGLPRSMRDWRETAIVGDADAGASSEDQARAWLWANIEPRGQALVARLPQRTSINTSLHGMEGPRATNATLAPESLSILRSLP